MVSHWSLTGLKVVNHKIIFVATILTNRDEEFSGGINQVTGNYKCNKDCKKKMLYHKVHSILLR